MGDDGGYNINDLPKVTAIISSKSLSRPAAFDILVRFLKSNIGNTSTSEETFRVMPRSETSAFNNLYECWEDLFHVAETLASRKPGEPMDSNPQQIALRNLRAGATLNSPEVGLEVTTQATNVLSESHDRSDSTAAGKVGGDATETPKRRSKKKSDRKKEKKQKRER